jgi:hypothetical protein
MNPLTPEDKQRIEEEERYRATVRANLAQERKSSSTSTAKRMLVLLLSAIAIGLPTAALVGYFRARFEPLIENGKPTSGLPNPLFEPVHQSIIYGQIVVQAGQSIWYPAVIPIGARNGKLTGHFTAVGGSGNDIQAAIVDQDNLTNWVNGHQARGFWFTAGPETTDSFDLSLLPGTYYVAFSNRNSIISTKQVFANVDLNYSKPRL